MKKTLLTAALVAGFASAAHAETSVTLYGLVDGGVGYNTQKTTWSGDFGSGSFKTRGFEFKNGVKNGNRWGLKGTEDLGNGTSAIFQLESGFDLGNGTQAQRDGNRDRLFGRKAVVGLTGESWGTLTLGRQYNAADDFIAPIDPFGTGWGQAAANSAFGGVLSARMDNVVKYVSPNFSGFQVGLGWTGDNNKDTYRNDLYGTDYDFKDSSNGITFGLGYNNGPIQAGFSYDYLRSKQKLNGITVGDDKVKAWNLGFAYDFDVVKLHLMYGQQNDGTVSGFGLAEDIALPTGFPSLAALIDDDGFRQKSWLLGLSAPVTEAGKVYFSYTGNNIKNNDVFDGKITSNIFSLGYLHSLSKRTSVYAVASYGQSKLKVNETVFDGQAKLKSTEVVLGLQHRF